MEREFRATQPGLIDAITAAGGFLQGVGGVAQGVGSLAGALAQPAARELMQAAAVGPPLARGAARLTAGTLRTGLSVTSHTARGVGSALQGTLCETVRIANVLNTRLVYTTTFT